MQKYHGKDYCTNTNIRSKDKTEHNWKEPGLEVITNKWCVVMKLQGHQQGPKILHFLLIFRNYMIQIYCGIFDQYIVRQQLCKHDICLQQ
jgi:hypothetical protein